MNKFLKIFRKIYKHAIGHKAISVVVAIAIVGGGYFGYKKFSGSGNEPRYIMGTVEKGKVTTTVSGSGQVSVSNQIDLKPKVSGDIVYLGVSNGQDVKAGTLIAQIDSKEANKAVRDAEANLKNAQITLEKLKGPEGAAIPRNKEQAQDDLNKAYNDGFNAVANDFLDLPGIMTGVHDILHGTDFKSGQANIDFYTDAVKNQDDKVIQYAAGARLAYQAARTAYDKNFADYKNASRYSDHAAVEALIHETYLTTESMAEVIKSATNLIQFYEDKLAEKNIKPLALADTHLNTLSSYTGKTNAHLLSLLNTENTIKNGKDAVINADLDIKSQELVVEQRENMLFDAKEKLSDYFIRAPFDSAIAKINIKKLDSITTGTAIATLITKQKFADISLNEVDVAKIKIGERATLTFDAVENLSISGKVAEIDSIGTENQGVVTYKVKIGFGAQDDRVKTGMSVSAAIVTNEKQNVIVVPASAVKSQGDTHYVEIFDKVLERKTVEIGLSDDVVTEIISGLNEGERVVVRTIAQFDSAATQQAPSLFGAPGNRSGGGTRIPR